MDFELPEELRLLKDTVRNFVDRELIPIEMTSMAGADMRPEVRAPLEEKAKKLGLWHLDVPQEYGGQGLNLLGMVVVWEEIARTVAMPPRGPSVFGPDIRHVLFTLNEKQKEKYLLPVLRGEKKTAFAQSEPDAGSDPGAMRTTAVRHGDHYVINGTKRWITGAADADFFQLVAATDRSKGSRGGLSMFLVDADTPGFKVLRKTPTMMGDEPCELALDDVKVPVENMIGGAGDGMKSAQKWITAGRLYQACRGLGVARRSIDLMVSYAKQRVTFGAPLGRAAGGAVHDRRQLHRASHGAADGVPARGAHRRGGGGAARELHDQDRRHRARVSRRRPLHADPRRHGARDRDADRQDVARCAQLHDHRGAGRGDADGSCAGDIPRQKLSDHGCIRLHAEVRRQVILCRQRYG